MRRNKKVWFTHRKNSVPKEKISIGPKEKQICDLLKKIFIFILNIFRDLKQTMFKELKESMRTMSPETEIME